MFRDGLGGVFTFGAVLGVTVYGISAANVLLFGVTANVVAAVGAVLGGLLDDRVGSKTVILGSLAAMIAVGLTLMALSGAAAFWVCGLLLCLFIGPTQASARTLLLRMTSHGKEGVAFGLYTMTGRAVAPLAPFMFSAFVAVFGADRAGIGGSTAGVGGGLHRDACGARAAQVGRGLTGRGADRQPRAGALLYLHTVDGDRAAHFAADVDDADTGGVLGRLGQLDFLAPRQHHVELGLQHATGVDVGDVDGPTVAGDVVHHGFGRTRH